MEPVEVRELASPELHDPVLVEGLPGTGLIGTLAANHLVEEFDGKLVRQIHSQHFPPNVTVDNDRTVSLDTIRVFAIEQDEQHLLVLSGCVQPEDSVGQYRLAETIFDIANDFGVTELYTLGGAIVSDQVTDHTTIGVVAEGSERLKDRLRGAGVLFQGEPSPEVIGGISGLLLGIGADRDHDVAGLMGTTSGFHVDPESAREVLESLQKALEFSVDLTAFERLPDEKRASVRHIQKKLQLDMRHDESSDEGLRYFG